VSVNSNTRTIRFNDEDIRDIDKFLKQNSIFDFSTLARIAIRRFIENPMVEVKGINEPSTVRSRKRTEAEQ